VQATEAINSERRAAQSQSYQQWVEQGPKNPHSASHFGQYAFKELSALSSFDPGVNAFSGVTVWMEAHKQNDVRYRPARDASSLQRLGTLTPAFVLQVLAPLLLILLGFSMFSGERERGTQTLCSISGVTPQTMLAGKLFASAVVVLLMVLPAIAAVSIAGDSHAVHEHFAPDFWARAGFMALAYLAYLGGFACLGAGVSALVSSSRIALVILLGFWIINSFMMPRWMSDVANQRYATPSAIEFQEKIAQARKASTAHDATHPAYQGLLKTTLARFGVQDPKELPFDFDGLVLKQDDEFGYRVFDQIYGQLWAQFMHQERFKTWAGLVVPVLAIQQTSMGLAGTDLAHHLQFARAAEQHRRSIQTLTANDLIRNRRFGDRDYVAGPELWKTIPPFDHQVVSILAPGEHRTMVGLGFRVLLSWLAATLLFAWWAVARVRQFGDAQ
jgi:ABC-2 type transport system permease protein